MRTASANENVPAATFAEYSPRLWPATNATFDASPSDSSTRYAAMLAVRIAGCVFSVSISASSGPVPDQPAQRLAERLVRFGKHLPRRRKGLGQRAAHADLLRSLSWKHECNHETDAVAISCSTRCRKPAVENRWAMRMALRMALADERPWQTKQTPATPSSGAPPYSE